MARASGTLSRNTLRYLTRLIAKDDDRIAAAAAHEELSKFDGDVVAASWEAALRAQVLLDRQED
jgi:hypothetical protein